MNAYIENCKRVAELKEQISRKRDEMKHIIRRIAEEEVSSHRITTHAYDPENVNFVQDVIQFDDKLCFEREQQTPLKDMQGFLYSVSWKKKEGEAVLEVMNPDLSGKFFEKVKLQRVLDPEGMCDYFFGNAYRKKVADTRLYQSLLMLRNDISNISHECDNLLRRIELEDMNILIEKKFVSLPNYQKIISENNIEIDDNFLSMAWSDPSWGIPAHYIDSRRPVPTKRPCLILAAKWETEKIPNYIPSVEDVLVHIIDTRGKIDRIVSLSQIYEVEALGELFHHAGVLQNSNS